MVLTGANRSRGTTTAPASSKHSMAEPMAVSSWNTGGLLESRGFTVFLFLISGSFSTPLLASSFACITHMSRAEWCSQVMVCPV